MTVPDWPAGTFTPDPGAASPVARWAAQTRTELLLLLRNGEQLLLTLVIPLGLLVTLSLLDVVTVDGATDRAGRADFFVPGVMALAVMSTAFTGQAIGTGFERQYAVLKRLGATPLTRGQLLAAKSTAVLLVELLQLSLLAATGLALGWSPHGSPLSVAVLLLAGTAAFSGLGLLLGGTLRGLTTLALANLLWLVLLVLGGVAFPVDALGPVAPLAQLLPSGALATGLRDVLADGAALPWGAVAVLAAWATAAAATAARSFRWE